MPSSKEVGLKILLRFKKIKIMVLSSVSVKEIIRSGASVVVSTQDYNSTTLKEMAAIANATGVRLTVKVNSSITSVSLKEIASTGRGHVTIDLS